MGRESPSSSARSRDWPAYLQDLAERGTPVHQAAVAAVQHLEALRPNLQAADLSLLAEVVRELARLHAQLHPS